MSENPTTARKRALAIGFRGNPYVLRDLPELTGISTKCVEREGVQVGDRLNVD